MDYLYVVQQFVCVRLEEIDMHKPEELEGLALQYAFLKALKCDIVGHPDGPFALYDEGRDVILIFSNSPEAETVNIRLTTNGTEVPMTAAKNLKAAFSVENNVVTCSLDGCQGCGESYAEAAMRAFLRRANTKGIST